MTYVNYVSGTTETERTIDLLVEHGAQDVLVAADAPGHAVAISPRRRMDTTVLSEHRKRKWVC